MFTISFSQLSRKGECEEIRTTVKYTVLYGTGTTTVMATLVDNDLTSNSRTTSPPPPLELDNGE